MKWLALIITLFSVPWLVALACTVCNISNTRGGVSSNIQTLRSGLKRKVAQDCEQSLKHFFRVTVGSTAPAAPLKYETAHRLKLSIVEPWYQKAPRDSRSYVHEKKGTKPASERNEQRGNARGAESRKEPFFLSQSLALHLPSRSACAWRFTISPWIPKYLPFTWETRN